MDTLINRQGQVSFGVFPTSPKNINYLDFDLRNNMDKAINGFRKKMRFNQFQFIGLTGDDLILGVAIVNLKWVSNCFLYIYQPSTQTFTEYSWLKPFALNTQTDTQPNNGSWSFKSGHNHISITSLEHLRQLKISCGNELNVDVSINETQSPLDVCCRAGYNGWVYTQKNTALPFTGHIQWRGQDINTQDLLASVDWSCGYMRRETFWHWASLSHKTQNGDTVGFNLAAGVNETSYTENALWINSEMIKLDRAEFIFDRSNRMAPWQIKTSDGHIDLTFTPAGERKEKINAGLIASNFTQVFGRFNGSVKNLQGETISISNATGFCEDHFAKW
ncbi:DUF2804 domain-containing protein [Bermanella sp. WJH001]|uniref:DUF2804 domain-containing protein n=1 Tax=Bermanella sp. WJH001 TaxID=3048005 RepID=UPI0024BE6486|nr:DUF2804 domain-containing protein [Bermanella sp. WJH001]MDJ1537361.1 DUF2804 domain-containing protein [Bermanella sp. WJH001]